MQLQWRSSPAPLFCAPAAAAAAATAAATTMPPLPLLRRAPPCPSAMRFVVVGGGVAGVCCAEELCRLRPQDEVTLVSASRVLKASPRGWETTVDSLTCSSARTGRHVWEQM